MLTETVKLIKNMYLEVIHINVYGYCKCFNNYLFIFRAFYINILKIVIFYKYKKNMNS